MMCFMLSESILRCALCLCVFLDSISDASHKDEYVSGDSISMSRVAAFLLSWETGKEVLVDDVVRDLQGISLAKPVSVLDLCCYCQSQGVHASPCESVTIPTQNAGDSPIILALRGRLPRQSPHFVVLLSNTGHVARVWDGIHGITEADMSRLSEYYLGYYVAIIKPNQVPWAHFKYSIILVLQLYFLRRLLTRRGPFNIV
jgi:hypothetical protein